MDIEKLAAIDPGVDEDAVDVELAEYVEQSQVVRDEPWQIANVGQADWAMRKLAALREAVAEYEHQIDLWRRAYGRLTRAADWFEERLGQWALANRSKDRKSFPLAHGHVSTRETKAAIQIDDHDTVVEWAEKHEPGIVEVTKRVKITDLRAHVEIGALVIEWEAIDKDTGEVEHVPVASPYRWTEAKQKAIERKLGKDHQVTAVTEPAVFYGDSTEPVPGTFVAAGYVKASVKPYTP